MSEHVSVAELIALSEDYLAKSLGSPIARVRWDAVLAIRDALKSGGYPGSECDQLKLSLVPFVFQEANYDNIDWGARDPIGHHQLRELLQLDFLTQMAGQRREEASDSEIETYRRRSLQAIRWRLERYGGAKRDGGGSQD